MVSSDEVKDFILQKFNDNSTMAAAQMQIDLLKQFPEHAKDQIPYSQQRKTGKDIKVDATLDIDVMVARCRQILADDVTLKTDVTFK